MELWDAYDEKFGLIEGQTLIRGEKIPDGMYHLVCDIIVKHNDGSYLLMQRDSRKHFGGMWEATAGGSALKGENPLTCAVRELKEETGIATDNLTEVGIVTNHRNRTIFVEFLAVTNCDKSSVTLQEGETQAYQWVDRETLVNMSRRKLVTDRMMIFLRELQKV